MKADYQPRTFVCKDNDNNLIGNYRLITERWRQFFQETLIIKDDMGIREEIIYKDIYIHCNGIHNVVALIIC